MNIWFILLLILTISSFVNYGYSEGWQNVFCKISIYGSPDILECDGIKDTLVLKGGNNIQISMDNLTDTITIDATIPNNMDIKSGAASVLEGGCTLISFNTSFSSMPNVIGTITNNSENNNVSVGSISTDGFALCLENVGSDLPAIYTVEWIATNIGDP